VGQSISAPLEVLPYEQAEELVRAQDRIVVAPCICRRERKVVGEGCDRPEETCLSFGRGADYYQRNGLGRPIDLQEALEILRQAEKAGLVLQPGNAQKAMFICCCCGCCCGVLRNLKRHPRPATVVSSPFVAAADAGTCKGCGLCLNRCQMDALSLADGRVVLDADRCIGCGLCVTTCPAGSLTLVRKPSSEQRPVPRNVAGTMVRLWRERGKTTLPDLLMMVIKSQVDRLLAKREAR
jgi:Fe-S-cluster-containing hydrogenase component 2